MRLTASFIALSVSVFAALPTTADSGSTSFSLEATNAGHFVIDIGPLLPGEIPAADPILELASQLPGYPGRVARFMIFPEPTLRPWATLQIGASDRASLQLASEALRSSFAHETTARGFRYLFTRVCSDPNQECLSCAFRFGDFKPNQTQVECR